MLLINTNNYGSQQRPVKENEDLVNEKIRFPEVLVIDQDGNSLGVKSRFDALRLAEQANLDLLCVAPMAKPPVCKILNYMLFKHYRKLAKTEILAENICLNEERIVFNFAEETVFG